MSFKTVLVIDGAENCAYDCFEASDALFARIFPAEGQDVEFIEDYMARSSEAQEDLWESEWQAMWARRVLKRDTRGIHGTLFYESKWKKKYYPSKRESDIHDVHPLDAFNNGPEVRRS